MSNVIYPISIILVVFAGAIAIAYFYFSADIFADILKKPLRIISVGMLVINLGIVAIAYLSYESSQGVNIDFIGVPLSTCFYIFYFLGSIMIIFGSRKFTRHSSEKSSMPVSGVSIGSVGGSKKEEDIK